MCLSYLERQVIFMAAETADTSVRFDISLELGKIKKAVEEASKKVDEELGKAFTASAR